MLNLEFTIPTLRITADLIYQNVDTSNIRILKNGLYSFVETLTQISGKFQTNMKEIMRKIKG